MIFIKEKHAYFSKTIFRKSLSRKSLFKKKLSELGSFVINSIDETKSSSRRARYVTPF